MTADRPFCVSTIALLLYSATALAADALRHDLFARPLLSALSRPSSGDTPHSAEPQPTWSPKLTAVLVAGKESIANVEGTILKVGQELDGHKLLWVREGAAVFSMNDQLVVLQMPQPEANRLLHRSAR